MQRGSAMPMTLFFIGRVERSGSVYWWTYRGAFDSPARNPSTRQSLVRETAPFTCRYFSNFGLASCTACQYSLSSFVSLVTPRFLSCDDAPLLPANGFCCVNTAIVSRLVHLPRRTLVSLSVASEIFASSFAPPPPPQSSSVIRAERRDTANFSSAGGCRYVLSL